MRFPVLAAACMAGLLAAVHGLAGAQAPASPFALTLNDALRQAELASPVVKLREAQLKIEQITLQADGSAAAKPFAS